MMDEIETFGVSDQQLLLHYEGVIRLLQDELSESNTRRYHLNVEIEALRAENARMRATLKGIEIYSSSHDDARGMAAKALLEEMK
jgi:hypothetical protein